MNVGSDCQYNNELKWWRRWIKVTNLEKLNNGLEECYSLSTCGTTTRQARGFKSTSLEFVRMKYYLSKHDVPHTSAVFAPFMLPKLLVSPSDIDPELERNCQWVERSRWNAKLLTVFIKSSVSLAPWSVKSCIYSTFRFAAIKGYQYLTYGREIGVCPGRITVWFKCAITVIGP